MPIPDDPTFARFARATRAVESARLPGAEAPLPQATEVTYCRVTSATVDGNGHYPAVVTLFSAPSLTWADYGAVKLRAPNGETLTNGTRYPARPAGVNGSDFVYVVTDVPSAGGGGGGTTVVVREEDGTPSMAADTIELDEDDGFVLTNLGSGDAKVQFADASRTQKGAVSTGAQDWAGGKNFEAQAGFLQATAGGQVTFANGGIGTVFGNANHYTQVGQVTAYNAAGANVFRVDVRTGSATVGQFSITRLEVGSGSAAANRYFEFSSTDINTNTATPELRVSTPTGTVTGKTETVTINYKDHAGVNQTVTLTFTSGLKTGP